MTITERMAACRWERRVLRRVSRAAWRLDQAERERAWALASARAEGISIRKLAAAAGLSPARVHQIMVAADLDELDAALGELRSAGWPAPEDPGEDDDAELDGRDLICDRLVDEVGWIRQCADWLTHLGAVRIIPALASGVQQTGRRDVVPGAVVTGTPTHGTSIWGSLHLPLRESMHNRVPELRFRASGEARSRVALHSRSSAREQSYRALSRQDASRWADLGTYRA